MDNNERKENYKKDLDIPLWEKHTLTVDEAAAYTGIGTNKLYELSNDPAQKWVLRVGNRRLIKRQLFEEFINDAYMI